MTIKDIFNRRLEKEYTDTFQFYPSYYKISEKEFIRLILETFESDEGVLSFPFYADGGVVNMVTKPSKKTARLLKCLKRLI